MLNSTLEKSQNILKITSKEPQTMINSHTWIPQWIGVDLDRTLAYYDFWKGGTEIGLPVESLIGYIKGYLAQSKKVKIFTARAEDGEETLEAIRDWCQTYLGQVLEITNKKDKGCVLLIDDIAASISPNTGLPRHYDEIRYMLLDGTGK